MSEVLPQNIQEPHDKVVQAMLWLAGLKDPSADPDFHWQTVQVIGSYYGNRTTDSDDLADLTRDVGLLSLLHKPAGSQDPEIVAVYRSEARRFYRLTVEQAYAENEGRDLAYHDSLTGALNRNSQKVIQNRWTIVNGPERRSPPPSRSDRAKLKIDLANFKQINDVIGYEIGDVALLEAVREISNITRAEDRPQIVRWGGDEFEVYIDEMPFAGFRSMMHRAYISQFDKVDLPQSGGLSPYARAWFNIYLMKGICQKTGTPFEPKVANEAGEDGLENRVLLVNGKKLCALRDIVVLSVGGQHGEVTNLADYKELDAFAESLMQECKVRLHRKMVWTYRTADVEFDFKPDDGSLSLT